MTDATLPLPPAGRALAALADQVLTDIERAGTLRQLRTLEGAVTRRMHCQGRDVVLFSSGNYLDLAGHPQVVQAAARAARELGTAASGSRLITGNLSCHDALERELAAFFEREAALVFSTGYMLNAGVIPVLVGPGDVILSDALVHASIIDGARLSRAEVMVFPHADVAALAARLEEVRPRARRILVVADGVYSMDGDIAPLAQIVALARQYDAISFVDDAHGTGTLGARGRGVAELAGVLQDVDILAGTLGKGLGSFGAFLVGSARLRDLLVNTARSFIFSCALAPPQVEAARAALALVAAEPWRRERLQQHASALRTELARGGISTAPSTTHIVPVVVGNNQAVLAVQAALFERGYHAQGIRYPSVPHGTARLRLTPMATHTSEEISGLARAVIETLTSLAPHALDRAGVGPSAHRGALP
jgi:glycine C-acetyltransferase